MSETNGTKSRIQLRKELKSPIAVYHRDIPELRKELEEIYNERSKIGKTPSELFERLMLVMDQEEAILEHKDRDLFYVCPTCGAQ